MLIHLYRFNLVISAIVSLQLLANTHLKQFVLNQTGLKFLRELCTFIFTFVYFFHVFN